MMKIGYIRMRIERMDMKITYLWPGPVWMLVLSFLVFCGNITAQFSTDPSPYCYPKAVNMTSGTCTKIGGNDGYRFRYVSLHSRSGMGFEQWDSACYGSADTNVYRRWNHYSYMKITGKNTIRMITPMRTASDTISVGCWIDFNQDSTFDADELIVSSNTASFNGGISMSFDFTVPKSAVPGKTRMRMRVQKGDRVAGTDMCSTPFGYGETWDFDVTLIEDYSAPVIALFGAYPDFVTLNCDSAYINTQWTKVSDETDDTPVLSTVSNVNRTRIGSYKVVYTAEDKAGNISVPISLMIRVVPTVPPRKECFKSEVINGKVAYIAYSFSNAVTGFKWYIDGQYQSGMDNRDTLFYPFGDTVNRIVCMQIAYCDTSFTFCGNSIGKPYGLSGKIYHDRNGDCLQDSLEKGCAYVLIKLHDSSGNMLYGTYTDRKGHWEFNEYFGKFKVSVDTSDLGMFLICGKKRMDTLIRLTPEKPLTDNINFGVVCKDIDITISSLVITAPVPGRQCLAGFLFGGPLKWKDLHCPVNAGGKVNITFSGKIKYSYTKGTWGMLQPDSVKANTLVYNISNLDSFYYLFPVFDVDSSATISDSVCISAVITTTGTDINPFNNGAHRCVGVSNSYDPNIKQVEPKFVNPGYKNWLTYTVHFQNTGNGKAYNVKIKDTLDELLDIETFQVLNYSHPVQTRLNKRALDFLYADIMLPDSTSDEQGSHGFVQYRIKPKSGLKFGQQVRNTAYIYFDYNPAVVTNTAVVEVKEPKNSISTSKGDKRFTIYPNPGTGKFYILPPTGTVVGEMAIEVYNVLGNLVYAGHSNDGCIDLSAQPDGIYVVLLKNAAQSEMVYLVKQSF